MIIHNLRKTSWEHAMMASRLMPLQKRRYLRFSTWNLYNDKQLSHYISAYNNLGFARNQNLKGPQTAFAIKAEDFLFFLFGASIIVNTILGGRESQTHAWFMLLKGRLLTQIQEGTQRRRQIPFCCYLCPCSHARFWATWMPTNMLNFQLIHARCGVRPSMPPHCFPVVGIAFHRALLSGTSRNTQHWPPCQTVQQKSSTYYCGQVRCKQENIVILWC